MKFTPVNQIKVGKVGKKKVVRCYAFILLEKKEKEKKEKKGKEDLLHRWGGFEVCGFLRKGGINHEKYRPSTVDCRL